MASRIGTEILETDGQNILWVLDGWDELPSDLPRESIIKKLIQPGMSQESPLHESTVIITSRPSSLTELHPLVSSRVEVLGFTPHELEQYFTECLHGDLQAVHTLLDRIRENPLLEGSCYPSLNASIVVNCFLSENYSLPTSNHEIFISVVQSSLKRYLQERLGTTIPVGNIRSPDSLPLELRTLFLCLCRLAYRGIDTNKVTFTDQDLTTFSVSKEVSNVGLVQAVPSILGDGRLLYYCFLHLSIQELLAAIHISLKTPKKQISTFQKLFGKPRFNAVFQFYAGITKLRNTRPILNKLPRFLCPVPASIFDLVRKIIKTEQAKNDLSHPLLISLLNCLYEAEDSSSLCASVADLLDNSLNFSGTTLNPIDCLSVGYFASVCTNINNDLDHLELTLIGCSISDQGCKNLTGGFLKCLYSDAKLQLVLWDNDTHNEGVSTICKLLKNTERLVLTDNPIENSGLTTLCESLSTNSLLLNLSINNCSLSLEDHGAIPQLLRTNTTLQHLDLSNNIIGNIELNNICIALSNNTSLFYLNLSKCSLTISDDNGPALYKLLSENKSLKFLDLSENAITTFCHIAAGLAVNTTSAKLSLNNCTLNSQSGEELNTRELEQMPNIEITNKDLENVDRKMNITKTLTMYNLL